MMMILIMVTMMMKKEEKDESAAEVYSRPLLYFKRPPPRRRGRNRFSAPSCHDTMGPTQLLLPDGNMSLGFPPVKIASDAERRRRAEQEAQELLENVVVFTSPSDEQYSKAKLYACILLFLMPADLILICSIYFLEKGSSSGGSSTSSSSDGSDDILGSGNQPTSDGDPSSSTLGEANNDLVTFLASLFTLFLGCVGLKLRDVRILTLFVVLFYIDALLNLVRVNTILQLAQFFMQIGVAHPMTAFKNTLLPQWWIADQ